MEVMQTYRMVADTQHGPIAIDVLLRGAPDGVAELHDVARAWLDVGCGYAGAWVDNGTSRITVTRSVSPPTPCAHEGDPVISCGTCGATAIIDATRPCDEEPDEPTAEQMEAARACDHHDARPVCRDCGAYQGDGGGWWLPGGGPEGV